MKTSLLFCCALALIGVGCSAHAFAAPEIGKAAPDFAAVDANGKMVHLSDFKGKEVILEWSNDSCPYVKKWYGSGEMQKLQSEAIQQGAIWLTILSSAPGQEGFITGEQANEDTTSRHAMPSDVLLDPSGTVGHIYNAMTTPHMYVIGRDGNLAYMGGADSIASTDPQDIKNAEPYAKEAIDAVAKGEAVPNPITRPYGCNVKYKS